MNLISIEFISHLNALNLGNLGLSKMTIYSGTNNISNIRSLRKTYFPNISKINLRTYLIKSSKQTERDQFARLTL